MTERIIMAGFGGQGIMMIGKLLATVAMDVGKQVTYFPSYGAEVRGGTAHCHVVISDEPIYSPVVEDAETLLVMNQPSCDRFAPRLREGGLLLLNASMIAKGASGEGLPSVRRVAVPATETANELGNVRVANVIMLGAYAAARKEIPAEAILAELKKTMKGRLEHLFEINRTAFLKGQELAGHAL